MVCFSRLVSVSCFRECERPQQEISLEESCKICHIRTVIQGFLNTRYIFQELRDPLPRVRTYYFYFVIFIITGEQHE